MSIAIHLSQFWKGYVLCWVGGVVFEFGMIAWKGPRGNRSKVKR